MTRADELLALAAKVEALTGPDRLVDAEIGACLQRSRLIAGGRSGEGIAVDEINPGHIQDTARGWWAPKYTASLAAAMMLVPEGWRWWKAGDSRTGGSRMVVTDTIEDGRFSVLGECPCADTVDRNASALTAAALRARAALAAIETGAAA